MVNIRKWLEDAVAEDGESIEAIVVGKHDNRAAGANENIVLSVEDGLQKLDEDYDNGFGGADCYPMYAWTKPACTSSRNMTARLIWLGFRGTLSQ